MAFGGTCALLQRAVSAFAFIVWRPSMERITVWLARIGFLSIAACTFGLSFDAISDVARNTGAVDPSLAWIVPLAVDGMIVTATAVLWTESLSGRGLAHVPVTVIVRRRLRRGRRSSTASGQRTRVNGSYAAEDSGPVHVGRNDDTGRITLDIPHERSSNQVWSRIIAAVQEAGVVPTQRQLANELNVPRSRVQRAIERNRGEWETLRQRIESVPETASVGVGSEER
jgi:hypothetical protein